ncbi:UNVERIFIED_CONTAM: hypothetical protein Sindi_1549000 [Sesamum indicum]
MEMTKADPNKIYTVHYTVNLRPRLDPSLSEYHFGNTSWLAIAMQTIEADGRSELLRKVREAIRAMNGEYVAQLRQGDKHLISLQREWLRLIKASWSRLPSQACVGIRCTKRISAGASRFGWRCCTRIGIFYGYSDGG